MDYGHDDPIKFSYLNCHINGNQRINDHLVRALKGTIIGNEEEFKELYKYYFITSNNSGSLRTIKS